MIVNAPKSSAWLSVVVSPYLRDDGTPKTIAEILGKTKDEKRELQDFSEALQSRVEIQGNSVTLKIAEGLERTLLKWKREHKLTSQSASPLSKQDIITFIQEVFGKNNMSQWNDNFFMLGGKHDGAGRELVAFFHSVVWLDSGKHYWLADRWHALYIDTKAEMLYIVKLDTQSEAFNF